MRLDLTHLRLFVQGGDMQHRERSRPNACVAGVGKGPGRLWVISVGCAALPGFPLYLSKADTQMIAGVRRCGREETLV